MIFQESETVELKSIVVDDIKKEIIAFANCEGGKLYIGVSEIRHIPLFKSYTGSIREITRKLRSEKHF